MAKKTYKRNHETEAARAELIALSTRAQAQIALLKATTGATVGVNEVLLAIYQEQTGCTDFRRFDEWKDAGYNVKKGEKSFRVWGSPLASKKTTGGDDFAESESVEVSTEDEGSSKYKYWPMCSLFNEAQVEQMDPGTVAGNPSIAAKLPVIAKQDQASAKGTNDPSVATASPFISSSYAENLEARKESREDRARAASQRADQLAATARKMADVIPFGQPILVGHHSERRDRAYRGRIGAKMDKAVDEFKKASYYQEKAACVGRGGIASDDPDALHKLAEKLEKAERLQVVMKTVNKALRAGDDQALAALDFSPKQIEELKRPDFGGRVGFASYQLTNNNAEIRRLKARIEDLKSLRAGPGIEHDHEDFSVTVDEGRVVIDFKHGKPTAEARKIAKDAAFKFSRSRGGAWVRKATANALAAAESVIKKLEALPSIY